MRIDWLAKTKEAPFAGWSSARAAARALRLSQMVRGGAGANAAWPGPSPAICVAVIRSLARPGVSEGGCT
eukprot:10064151-Alexandrium_andersonii.AAC.1